MIYADGHSILLATGGISLIVQQSIHNLFSGQLFVQKDTTNNGKTKALWARIVGVHSSESKGVLASFNRGFYGSAVVSPYSVCLISVTTMYLATQLL